MQLKDTVVYVPVKQRNNRLHAILGAAWAQRAVTLIAFCFLISGCHKEQSAPPPEKTKLVKIITVAPPGLTLGKEYPGRAEASRTADLSFRVAGPLIQRPIKQGDRVKQGDLLAKIDPRDFESRAKSIASELDQAKAELASMKAGARPEDILRLEANQRARKSELEELQLRLDRNSTLLKQAVISQQEYDLVRRSYDVARANLESADQELLIGRRGARVEDIQAQEAKVKSLEAQLAVANAQVSDTELRASFPGAVAKTYVENFEDVQAKQPILSIQDTSRIDIKIYVPETDLGRGLRGRSIEEAAKSLKAEATFGALSGKRFPLTVKEYQTEADPKTQTFEIVLQMVQPPDNPVIPGMNATVRGQKNPGARVGEGFLVPVAAVFADVSGKKNVWVVDPKTQQIKKRLVEADWMASDQIHVTKGLSAGEKIVSSGVDTLNEDMKVAQMPDLGEM